MARIARVVIPAYPHHVVQRGSRRQKVFYGAADYRNYLDLLSAGCERAGTACWAYCLMPNHVHLVLVPSEVDGLRYAVAKAHQQHARRINHRYDWRGHLWQERFHSFPMDEAYLLACVRYVERNPVSAGLCKHPAEWPWSSARAHLAGTDDALVCVAPMLERFANWHSYLDSENHALHERRIRRHNRTGRPLGSPLFLEFVERLTGRTLRELKPGRKPARAGLAIE